MVQKRSRDFIILLVLLLSACTTTLTPYNPNTFGSFTPTINPNQEDAVPTLPLSTELDEQLPEATEPQNDPTFVWVETATPAVVGLQDFADGINPLTGLPVENTQNLQRRPLMIKVSNYPRSGRPHAGLTYADMVFEYYIGEEMNRFLAVFYSEDSPKVGPLRSGRLIDAQLASMYGGILVYGGADPKVDTNILNVLHERAFTNNSSPCPPICGQDTHSVSGVFVDSKAMSEFVDRKGVDNTPPVLNGLIFDPVPPNSEEFAVKIGVEYSFRDRGEWHFDPQSGDYLRWIEADDEYTMIPLVDRVNNDPVTYTNIVILFVTYVEYAPTLHDILVWDNETGSKAIVFRDGVALEGTWMVPDHEQPIQLYNRYGLPLALKPGKSWFVFVGNRSVIERPQEGQWEIQFDLP